MTTRRQLQSKPQGKHRPSYVVPYVSLFGIPQGNYGICSGRRWRQRKLTVGDILNAMGLRALFGEAP